MAPRNEIFCTEQRRPLASRSEGGCRPARQVTRSKRCGSPPARSSQHRQSPEYAAPRTVRDLLRSVPPALRNEPVYSHIVTTIVLDASGLLVQTGSGPNFDGGRITLCACKHKDRATFFPSGNRGNPWEGVWVAGFTSATMRPARVLAYLMLVEESFLNQLDLWHSLPRHCRSAKSTRVNPIGDIYEPTLGAAHDPYDPANYLPPVSTHVHWPHLWTMDILPHGTTRKCPHHLLLGDPEMSCRWLTPAIALHPAAIGRTARHKMFPSLHEFAKALTRVGSVSAKTSLCKP